jgi:putative flippase GtrA
VDAFAYQMTGASTNSGYLGDADAVCEDAEVLRRLASSPLARLFTRFAAGTAVSTACSQLAFVLLFGVVAVSAMVSGAVAFVVGAVPNFLIHRFWTWRRGGPVGIRRELVPYLAMIIISGLVAIGMTTGVDRLIGQTIDDRALRTLVVAVAFNASYLPLFILKFALLDRLVFGRDEATLRRVERSRHQVPTITRA